MRSLFIIVSILLVYSISFSASGSHYRSGHELGALGLTGVRTIEGWAITSGATGVSTATNIFYDGRYSLRLNATSGVACEVNVISSATPVGEQWTPPGGNTNADRQEYETFWMYVASAPSSRRRIATLANAGSGRGVYLIMNSNRTLDFYSTASGTSLYLTSASVPLNTWTPISMECYIRNVAGTVNANFVGLGESFTGSSGALCVSNDESITYLAFGDPTTATGTFDIYIDNAALNFGQNFVYPPTDTKFLYRFAVSDSGGDGVAIGNWKKTGGNLGTLFQSINNLPYGFASEDSNNSIVNSSAAGTDFYRFNMSTPADNGVTGNEKITIIIFYVRYGQHTTATAPTIALAGSYNPVIAQAQRTLTGTAHGTADDSTSSTRWHTSGLGGYTDYSTTLIDGLNTVMYVEKLNAVSTQLCVTAAWVLIEYRPTIRRRSR